MFNTLGQNIYETLQYSGYVLEYLAHICILSFAIKLHAKVVTNL